MLDHARNAAVYCRLSLSPDGSVEKVDRQEADCRRLADQLGWRIDERHVYKDNSRSAWQRNRRRPGWDAMLAAIEAGEVDAIVVWHGDRLIRQPWDLELLLRLAETRHVRLASVTGTRDLSSADDQYILRIEVAGFCRSSADTSRRVTRGWQARAAKGLPVGGGKRPFGYGVPIVGRFGRTGNQIYDTTQVVPEEAAVLREAVSRLLAGHSQGGVVAWMNSVSTTSQGNRWDSRNLHHLLVSPRIAGLLAHDGQLREAAWPGIITREEWEDVKLVMAANAREHPYPGRERKYLLSGIAECSGCGARMRTKPTGGRNRPGSRLYYCANRDCQAPVGRNVEHLDRYVAGRVLRRLQDPDLLGEVLGPDPDVSAELVALERRKDAARETLRGLVDHPELDPADIAASLAGFDQRIAELRARHAATARQRLLARMAGISEAEWEATALDVRSATVRALFRVVVLPATWRGPGFDPASVRLEPVDA
jgi:DNA invertase Pin-like site-specific DNA recombinase